MAAPPGTQNQVPAWQPGDIADMPFERIADYPLLAQVLEVWEASAVDGLPSTIDPLLLPRAIIKGVNLFDIDPITHSARVRLAGELVSRFLGREVRGELTASIYVDSDLEAVQRSTRAALNSRRPNLARRRLIDSRGRRWIYVRLLLPLSSDGLRADRIATVIDPGSFGQMDSDRRKE